MSRKTNATEPPQAQGKDGGARRPSAGQSPRGTQVPVSASEFQRSGDLADLEQTGHTSTNNGHTPSNNANVAESIVERDFGPDHSSDTPPTRFSPSSHDPTSYSKPIPSNIRRADLKLSALESLTRRASASLGGSSPEEPLNGASPVDPDLASLAFEANSPHELKTTATTTPPTPKSVSSAGDRARDVDEFGFPRISPPRGYFDGDNEEAETPPETTGEGSSQSGSIGETPSS
ncbi:uncharacterized protein JCM15063_002087 [Sporobolomyces koalae]|uniref:uncharacterized protein n=1 Tax=Sporobolomyces koalae TaxID=500713 RepID=UPI003175D17F